LATKKFFHDSILKKDQHNADKKRSVFDINIKCKMIIYLKKISGDYDKIIPEINDG